MENIKLENGKFLNRLYGKYMPDITLISGVELDDYKWKNDFEKFKKEDDRLSNLLFDGTVKAVKGFYRENAKGTKIFEISETGNHYLISVDWGGCFNSSRGGCRTPNIDFLYQIRKSSNGGGAGGTYYVIDANNKTKLTEDDF